VTLRTIDTPFDPETNAELQAKIGTYLGTTWANLPTVLQTEYQRIIDASAEYLSKRFGHEPWMIHEEDLALAADTATLTLAAECRHVLTLIETYDGKTRTVQPTTKREWMLAWGTGADSHPWSTQTRPYWFFDGMDDSNPPLQQWKRVPTPDKAITGTALYRPYLTLRGSSGDTQYSHIPANAAMAQEDYILARVEKQAKNFDKAGVHKQFMEDEISAIQVADNPEGAWETAREVEAPGWVGQEMDP